MEGTSLTRFSPSVECDLWAGEGNEDRDASRLQQQDEAFSADSAVMMVRLALFSSLLLPEVTKAHA
jgi:hypothetical protein